MTTENAAQSSSRVHYGSAAVAAAVLLAEASVAFAAFGLLLRSAGTADSLALAGPGLLGLAFTLQVLLRFRPPPSPARLVVAALAGALAVLLVLHLCLFPASALWDEALVLSPWHDLTQILVAFPYALLLSLLAAAVWIRGTMLGWSRIDFRAAAVTLQFGISLLLLLSVLSAITMRPVPHVTLIILFFFSSSLLAIALAHRHTVALSSPGRDRQWLAVIAGSIVVALGVGTAVGLFLDDKFIRLLLLPIQLVGDVLGLIIDWLARLIPPAQPVPTLDLPPGFDGAVVKQDRGPLLAIPEEVRLVARIAWGVVVLALLLAAIYRIVSDIVSHLFRTATTPGAEPAETLRGAWLIDLRALCRGFLLLIRRLCEEARWRLYRLRHRPAAAHSASVGAIRETYRNLLYWTARRSLARVERETPHEYLRRLVLALPNAEEDLRALTETYVRARYCPHLVGDDDRHSAATRWQRLRRLLSA